MSRGVLLVGHGSRDAAGNAQFLALAQAMAARLGPALSVAPCFLDHAAPSISDGVDQLASAGVTDIAAVPLFLFAAGHAKADVPRHLRTARAKHPGLSIRYGSVLGAHQRLVQDCAAALAPYAGHRAETAVLLVGRGSSDPEANAGLVDTAHLLAAATGFGWVEVAYCDVAHPTLAEGVAQCLTHGARQVVLLPYFLFRGVLMDRLGALVARWQAEQPDVAFALAGREGLAAYGGALDLAVQRAHEALSAPPWE